MKTEQLLVELCKSGYLQSEIIQEAVGDGVDEEKLLGLALMHRVGTLVYVSIQELGLQKRFSREFMNTLSKVHAYDVTRSQNYKVCVYRLVQLLKSTDIPYALLKGAYLVNVYPKGARTSNDIDILIDQEHISAISKVLLDSGYEQGYLKNGVFEKASRKQIVMSRFNRGETVPFVKRVDLPAMKYLEIDLNYSLDYLPEDAENRVGAMLSKISDKENPFLMFDDFIIHLCCHLYKEASVYEWVRMERDQKLYKYCDLYWILRETEDPHLWHFLGERIKTLSLSKPCYYALQNTKDLFSMDNPYLDQLLASLENFKEDMNQIVLPQEKKIFTHDRPIVEWVFLKNKIQYLTEVK